MRLKTQLLPVLAAGLLFAACQADDIPGPDAKELYNRDFIKNFGVFDANHDWNMATQAGVTVSSATPTDVKIYADVNGSRYLFGTFQGVTGNRTLSVDVPKGTDRLIVNANGRDYDVAVGANITLDSRLITEDGATADNMLAWNTGRYRMLPTTGLSQFIEQYPEEKPNLGKGTTSFYFVSDGKEHTFYPFYWKTSCGHALGIYYIPDDSRPDDIVMQDLYFTKSGELYVQNWSPVCHTKVGPMDYKAGDVHLFGDQKQLFSDWQNLGIFPGLSKTELLDGASCTDDNMCNWKDNTGKDLFVVDQIYTYTQETAILSTANGYISRIVRAKENIGFTLTETVTKAYHSDFTSEMVGFDPAGSYDAIYIDGSGKLASNYVTTRAITYKFDRPGIKYGFYIKVNNNNVAGNLYKTEKDKDGNDVQVPLPDDQQNYNFVLFSQASRNASYVSSHLNKDGVYQGKDVNYTIRTNTWEDKDWWKDGEFTELDKTAYAAWGNVTIGGKPYSMFAFEDWDSGTNNVGADLNDLQFVFETDNKPTTVIIETPKTPTPSFMWIVAAEDLGITDFDFNDVVFGVTNPVEDNDGNKTVQIYPLAAGGTMPVYLYYNKTLINPEGTADGEFHSWFKGNHDSTKPINVGGYAAEGDPYTLAVDKDFTMACCTEGAYTNMGGFTIKVDKTADYEEHTITPPDHTAGVTAAPQMICLGTQWFWPTEMTHIWDPYPGFLEWCQNRDAAHNWHDHANIPEEHSGRVVRHNFGAGESGGGDTPIDPGKDPETPDPVKPTIPAGSTELQVYGDPIPNDWGGVCYRYKLTDEMKEMLSLDRPNIELVSVTLYVKYEGFEYYGVGYGDMGQQFEINEQQIRSESVSLFDSNMLLNKKDKATTNLAKLQNDELYVTYWKYVEGFTPGYVSIKIETRSY